MRAPQFQKSNKKRYAGSLIGIPIGESLVQTLVLWHSNRFKNVILLAPTDRLTSPDSDTTELGSPIGLLFSSAQGIRAGYWKYQGQLNTKIPPEAYTFICADHIYRGDEAIGLSDLQQGLMTLKVGGLAFVEDTIADILNDRVSDYLHPDQQLAEDIIRKHLSDLIIWG